VYGATERLLVPHIVASLMASRLNHGSAHAHCLAGQGVRDVTRIAAGDAGLWSDILHANARVLKELSDELGEMLATLNDQRPLGAELP
jgi:prephenate dehydrogenase